MRPLVRSVISLCLAAYDHMYETSSTFVALDLLVKLFVDELLLASLLAEWKNIDSGTVLIICPISDGGNVVSNR